MPSTMRMSLADSFDSLSKSGTRSAYSFPNALKKFSRNHPSHSTALTLTLLCIGLGKFYFSLKCTQSELVAGLDHLRHRAGCRGRVGVHFGRAGFRSGEGGRGQKAEILNFWKTAFLPICKSEICNSDRRSGVDASGQSSVLYKKFTYMLISAHELADNLLF